MIDNICDYSQCTGCKACSLVCPKKCISFEPDVLGEIKPVISSDCVECNRCKKVCQINNSPDFGKAKKCFASWSSDDNYRTASASGGVASTIYEYCLNNDIFTAGCKITAEGDCFFIPLKELKDIESVRNSKYTFSDTKDIFTLFKRQLEAGKRAIFIGLPCQVSALLLFLGKRYDLLLTIDIVCHGVAPNLYLKQHLAYIAQSHEIKELYFRDPKFGTNLYYFTLYDRCGKIFYKKRVYDNDTYQIGYHKSLIYRENCYSCRYARPERVSDITISDFSGFGRIEHSDIPNENISCILVNTDRGANFLKELNNLITIERPLEEALNFEWQLRAPSIPNPKRPIFIKNYLTYRQFDTAVEKTIPFLLKKYHIKTFCHTNEIKSFIVKMIPRRIKNVIKRFAK